MKWLILAPFLLIAVIISLSIYLQPNSFLKCGTTPAQTGECQKADAIVVVSGGDTEARTQAGIDLYKNGWAHSLILSGAAQDKSGPSNAAAMRLQAVSEGVPEEAIYIDEDALNTQQNAQNTKSILKDNNIDTIILVTSGYHQRRASLEFNKIADGAVVRNYPVVNDKDWSGFWWLTPRGWWLAGGEIVKVVAFYIGVTA